MRLVGIFAGSAAAHRRRRGCTPFPGTTPLGQRTMIGTPIRE